jgi:hypothetical protein
MQAQRVARLFQKHVSRLLTATALFLLLPALSLFPACRQPCLLPIIPGPPTVDNQTTKYRIEPTTARRLRRPVPGSASAPDVGSVRPSQRERTRRYRTRQDPFVEVWRQELVPMFEAMRDDAARGAAAATSWQLSRSAPAVAAASGGALAGVHRKTGAIGAAGVVKQTSSSLPDMSAPLSRE